MRSKSLNMMAVVGSVLMVGAVSAGSAFAQSPTPSPSSSPAARRQYMLEQRQEIRDEAKAKIQEKVSEVRTEVIAAMADRVEARFARHEERITNWIERSQKFIDKKEADGQDMTAAQTALDQTKTDLVAAVTQGDEAVAMIRALDADDWKSKTTELQAAREAVKAAHQSFVKTIQTFRQTLKSMKSE